MTAITYTRDGHNCVVSTGHLNDAYTGKSIDFIRGKSTSTAVQIDHLVPLGWAWQHGAATWTEEHREQIATDLNNLQAVDGPTNEAKSDQGPATWLPPAADYDCLYVTRFAYVLNTYELTIDGGGVDADGRGRVPCRERDEAIAVLDHPRGRRVQRLLTPSQIRWPSSLRESA